MSGLRHLLGLDWACPGCMKEGSRRWLHRHRCPERDRLEEMARLAFGDGGLRFYPMLLPQPPESEGS